jgi:hypothetical protein
MYCWSVYFLENDITMKALRDMKDKCALAFMSLNAFMVKT